MTYSRATTLPTSPGQGRVLSSVVLMLVLLLLSACSSVPAELLIQTAPSEIKRPDARPNLPNPQPIEQLRFKWKVITPDRLPEGDDWVFLGITPKAYEDTAKNTAEIDRFIKVARWLFKYYRGELPVDAVPPWTRVGPES